MHCHRTTTPLWFHQVSIPLEPQYHYTLSSLCNVVLHRTCERRLNYFSLSTHSKNLEKRCPKLCFWNVKLPLYIELFLHKWSNMYFWIVMSIIWAKLKTDWGRLKKEVFLTCITCLEGCIWSRFQGWWVWRIWIDGGSFWKPNVTWFKSPKIGSI